jgi:hypothetical protein
VLDIHGSNVIRQQHNLVAMQFTGVFLGQFGLLNAVHDVDNKIPCAHKGVDDVHVLIGERATKLLLENVFDRLDHEIDNGLRGVDDTVDIGGFDGKALKELFVNSVEKSLFLGIVVNGGCGGLDGAVETVQ